MSELPGAPDAAAHDEHEEEIHVPPNSYWPLVTAVGVTLGLLGIATVQSSPVIFIVGILVLLAGVGGWIRDARQEYNELH
jgi:hypothetical protein